MAAESGGMPEMSIASSIDLKNPLPERIATGPEYLEALGRLGFNAENLQSNLPFAVATQKAASSLITNQYAQQMEYQKAQAELALNMARARNIDSETNYNNKALQLRLAGLDTENKFKAAQLQDAKNKNDLFAATADAQINEANQRSNQADQLTKVNALKLKTDQRQSDDTDQALADQDAALASIAAVKPDAPDYESQKADAYNAHIGFATNQATRQRWADSWAEKDRVRGTLASVQRQKENVDKLQKSLDTNDLPDYVRDNLNAIANDPMQTHAWNAYSNLSATNKQITRITAYLNSTGIEKTPQIQAYLKALQAVQAEVNGMVADPDIAHKLATAQHSQYFDSNGNLHPEIQAELDTLDDYAKMTAQGLAKPEETYRAYAPKTEDDYLGTHRSYSDLKRRPGETDAQWNQRKRDAERGLSIPEAAFQGAVGTRQAPQQPPGPGAVLQDIFSGGPFHLGQALGSLFTRPPAATPQQRAQNQLTDQLTALQRADPSMRDVVQKALNGTPEEKAAARARIGERLEQLQQPPPGMQYGGLVGTETGLMKQGGGMIFDPRTVGAAPTGSTDTVPAMLTPGEYVVNAGATAQPGVKTTLDQINQMGQASGLSLASAPNIGNVAGAIAQEIRTAQRQPTAGKDAAQPTTAQPSSQQTVTPWWGGKNVTPWYGTQPQQPTSVSQPSTANIVPATLGAVAAGPVEPGPMGAPGGMFLNPATGSYEPLQTDAAASGIPIGQTVDGAAFTRYGYAGDSSWDPGSGKGMGDRDNPLQGGFSVALTQSMRKQLFPDAKVNPRTGLTSSTGRSFQWGGRTYRDDDSASPRITDARIDVYDPAYTGLDKGVTQQTADSRRKLMPQYAQRGAAPATAGPSETEPTASGYLRYAAAHPGTTMDQYEQLFTQATGFQEGGEVKQAGWGGGGAVQWWRTQEAGQGKITPASQEELQQQMRKSPYYAQRGGLVSEEGSIGTRGEGGRSAAGGGGGIEGELDAPVDPRQRHRRFHPRVGAAGQFGMGADIPDPMQKKLAKLSQDFLGGLSDLIKARPEMGPQLLRHARNQLAANMGGQPEDWAGMSGGAGESQQMRQASPGIPPEAYGGGMTAYGGREGEEPGSVYMRGGGRVGYQGGGMVGGAPAFPEDIMNQALLDPEGFGLGYMQRGGLVQPRMSNLLTAAHQGLYR